MPTLLLTGLRRSVGSPDTLFLNINRLYQLASNTFLVFLLLYFGSRLTSNERMGKDGAQSDYFERIIEAVESLKKAYYNRDMEEAAEYMGEVRSNRDKMTAW